jgi:hypothetical protein
MRKTRGSPFRIRAEHPIVHLASVIRQHQVQEDANNSSNDERSLHNQVDSLLKSLKMDIRPVVVKDLVEPSWCHDINEADPERDCQDETISARELN